MIEVRAANRPVASAFLATAFKFGLVGLSGVPVNFAVLILLHEVLAVPLLLAVPLAVEAAIINNFCWHGRWTFADRNGTSGAFLKFNASCLAGMVISAATVQVLVTSFGLHYLSANLFGIGLAAGSNFLLSSNWTWSKRSAL